MSSILSTTSHILIAFVVVPCLLASRGRASRGRAYKSDFLTVGEHATLALNRTGIANITQATDPTTLAARSRKLLDSLPRVNIVPRFSLGTKRSKRPKSSKWDSLHDAIMLDLASRAMSAAYQFSFGTYYVPESIVKYGNHKGKKKFESLKAPKAKRGWMGMGFVKHDEDGWQRWSVGTRVLSLEKDVEAKVWTHQHALDRNQLGVNGIVLTDDNVKQAVIAIKGTDLPDGADEINCAPGSGCRADLCADKKLFDIPTRVITELPDWCTDDHASGSHDYLEEATEFVKNALVKLEGYKVLLVGHSLGGALAIAVGARILNKFDEVSLQSLWVIAFSPPPFAGLLGSLQLTEFEANFVLIYNDLDPVLFATASRGGFAGLKTSCLSMDYLKKDFQPIVEDCSKCRIGVVNKEEPAEFGTIWPSSGSCELCYLVSHKLDGYMLAMKKNEKTHDCTKIVDGNQ